MHPGGFGRSLDPHHVQAIGDVLGDGHVREQRVVLEDDADMAAVWRQMVDRRAADAHLARGLPVEAGDDFQQRGFAAAGWAEQRHKFSRCDGKDTPSTTGVSP